MKKLQLFAVVWACLTTLISFSAHAVAVSGQGTWETTLLPRDLDGNNTTAEAYYDTVLDITWLADANYAGMIMDWATANSWAAGLNINGITGWRLPVANPIDGTTADDLNLSWIGTEDRGHNVSAPGTLYAGSTASELAYMFYNTLGNLSYCDPGTSTVSDCSGPQAGWGLSNTGPFSNLQSSPYWSATVFAPNQTRAWDFHFESGLQGGSSKTYTGAIYAWAVHPGDVGAPLVYTPVDTDGDGLLDNIEDKNGNRIVDPGETDPLNPDTDNDGVLDGQEDANHNGVVDAGESSPLDFDSDDDGLTDGYEINISGTDPLSSTTLIPGDMNGDGVVNAGDSVLHMREVLGN